MNNHMDLAPIVLFVYNRPRHTRQTVEALGKNELADQSNLIIYSDAHKNEEDRLAVSQVRKYLKTIEGFKYVKIIERLENIGLAASVIKGVTEVINNYGKTIVLEDDLITAQYFLRYMNEALCFYKEDSRVFSITGYNFPPQLLEIPSSYPHDIYFNPRFMSWGWATWLNRWKKADWEVSSFYTFIRDKKAIRKFNQGGEDLTPMLKSQIAGKIDSWAIRWCFTHFLEDGSCVYPVESLINNIGHDGSGVHCGVDKHRVFEVTLNNAVREFEFPEYLIFNNKLIKNFRSIFKQPGIQDKIKNKLKFLYYRFLS